MKGRQLATVENPPALRWKELLCVIGIMALSGCSNGQDVTETTYFAGMPTDTAVVQASRNGGYQTVSGDPIIAVNGGIERESMLPYGGGEQGIRRMEDESLY